MEIQKIIKGKTFPEIKNMFINEYNLIVKEDEKLPNLYLVTKNRDKDEYYKNLSKEHSFIEECNGIILEKNTNKVISMPFTKNMNFIHDDNQYNLTNYDMKWDNVEIQEFYEGTQIRLYNYNGEWNVATCRCLDAKRAKWGKYNFYDLFVEVAANLKFNWKNLEVGYSHILLFYHSKMKMVHEYENDYIIHLATMDLSKNNYPEIDYDLGLKKSEIVKNLTEERFWELITCGDLRIYGFVLKDKNSGKRLKVNSKIYEKAKDMLGNITPNNMIYRYLELKKEGKVKDYLLFYPEDGNLFRKYENMLDDMIVKIHQEYCDKFVNKKVKMNEVTFCFRTFIYNINGEYLKNTSRKMTKKRVAALFWNKEPAQIAFIFNNFYSSKETSKNKLKLN